MHQMYQIYLLPEIGNILATIHWDGEEIQGNPGSLLKLARLFETEGRHCRSKFLTNIFGNHGRIPG